MQFGWIHEEEDVERKPRDAAQDYAPYTNVGVRGYQGGYHASHPPSVEAGGSATAQLAFAGQGDVVTPTSIWGDSVAFRRFLDDAGAIPSG